MAINPILFSSFILFLTITTLQSSGIKKNDNRQKRIVGGFPTPIRFVPWQALIRQKTTNDSGQQCGAVLIGPKWILTAKHCINESLSDQYPILAYFGVTDLSEIYSKRRVIRDVIKIYNPDQNDPKLSGDLVLLELNETLRIDKYVRWIKLPEPNEDFDYRIGSVSGYGETLLETSLDEDEDEDAVDTLHSVRVPILSQSFCKELYERKMRDGVPRWLRDLQEDKYICAGQIEGGFDACYGDSGGPLAVCVYNRMRMSRREKLIMQYILQYQKNHPASCPYGEWKLAGIVSGGLGCGLPLSPGLYTNIKFYSKWIHSIIDHH